MTLKNEYRLDMDPRFHEAQKAMAIGDADQLGRLLDVDPRLATDRSTRSHPTILQCLVLAMPAVESLESMIALLASHGANLEGPLTAAAGMNNLRAIAKLLDLGANVEGQGSWSPLDEAIYWRHADAVALLIERGARVNNVRKASAIGDLAAVAACFDPTGQLNSNAGKVDWPFGDGLPDEDCERPQEILNNALVHAASWGRTDVVRFLLDHGAAMNAIPLGYDYNGTALHYAAFHGESVLVDRLLEWGADPTIPDGKIGQLAESWADHNGHPELAEQLRATRRG